MTTMYSAVFVYPHVNQTIYDDISDVFFFNFRKKKRITYL